MFQRKIRLCIFNKDNKDKIKIKKSARIKKVKKADFIQTRPKCGTFTILKKPS